MTYMCLCTRPPDHGHDLSCTRVLFDADALPRNGMASGAACPLLTRRLPFVRRSEGPSRHKQWRVPRANTSLYLRFQVGRLEIDTSLIVDGDRGGCVPVRV